MGKISPFIREPINFFFIFIHHICYDFVPPDLVPGKPHHPYVSQSAFFSIFINEKRGTKIWNSDSKYVIRISYFCPSWFGARKTSPFICEPINFFFPFLSIFFFQIKKNTIFGKINHICYHNFIFLSLLIWCEENPPFIREPINFFFFFVHYIYYHIFVPLDMVSWGKSHHPYVRQSTFFFIKIK